jgi:heme-degrading monooxygenase HmoA
VVVEHAYLVITPGREEEFEAAFGAAAPVLAGAAGCRGAELFADAEQRGGYLLRVRWERLADHLEVFPASPAGTEFAAAVAHFFAEPPTVRHFAEDPVGR